MGIQIYYCPHALPSESESYLPCRLSVNKISANNLQDILTTVSDAASKFYYRMLLTTIKQQWHLNVKLVKHNHSKQHNDDSIHLPWWQIESA